MALPLILAAGQAAMGLGQMLFSGKRKAEREFEGLQMPKATTSPSISGYYQTALQRYGVSPTESAMYKRQQQNIQRGVATGLSNLRGRGAALAGVGRLVGGASDAALNAEIAAEQERNRRFAQLGQATQMQSGEERRVFDINEMMPFQRKERLAQMKLGAAQAMQAAGMQNIGNAGQLAAIGLSNGAGNVGGLGGDSQSLSRREYRQLQRAATARNQGVLNRYSYSNLLGGQNPQIDKNLLPGTLQRNLQVLMNR